MKTRYQLLQQGHLQVSNVADTKAQTRQQRIHQKPGFQLIAVLENNMAHIRRQGINLPRVGPGQRQKRNRNDAIITPLMAMGLVILHPQQPVVSIAINLVQIRVNQNKRVLIIPVISLDDRHPHIQANHCSDKPHHPGLGQAWPRPAVRMQTDPGSSQCMLFPLPFNRSQTASVTREPNDDEQNIVQIAAKEYDEEPAAEDLPLRTARSTWPQQEEQPVQTQQHL